MPSCVCATIVTNRVGVVGHPDRGVLYRFALDCPVHGIVSDRSEEIILKEDLDHMSEAELRAHFARERRDKRKKRNERKNTV